jgi:hypothetical protein
LPLQFAAMTSVEERTAPAGWKKWLIVGASAGGGFAVVCALLIAGVVWWSSRPAGWDTDAVTVLEGRATEFFTLEGNDFQHAGFSLAFALQNETNRDITIPTGSKIMRRAERGVLREQSTAKIDQAAFLPARQRAELSLRIQWSCVQFDAEGVRTERKASECYSDYFSDVDALVVFDETNHLQLVLPKTPLQERPGQ